MRITKLILAFILCSMSITSTMSSTFANSSSDTTNYVPVLREQSGVKKDTVISMNDSNREQVEYKRELDDARPIVDIQQQNQQLKIRVEELERENERLTKEKLEAEELARVNEQKWKNTQVELDAAKTQIENLRQKFKM